MIRCGVPCIAMVMSVALGAASTGPVRAAEIGCDTSYDGAPVEEAMAEKLWPAGFRPSAGLCRRGFIRGSIARGDYDKVREFYARHHPYLTTFFLVSSGGDLEEALKIGLLFRKYLIEARAPIKFHDGEFYLPHAEHVTCNDAKCMCVSACALVWFGAVTRAGVVGLHRPRNENASFKALPPDKAFVIYKQMFDTIAHYLHEVEAPQAIVDAVAVTGSADIHWADAHDGLARAPSFAEWVDASCGRMSSREHDIMLELQEKTKLSEGERDLLKTLLEQSNGRESCQRFLVSSSRERLARPEKAAHSH